MSVTIGEKNPAAEVSEERIPPRFWWLKRLGGVYGVVLFAFLGFHWWWTVHTRAQLDQRIACVQAAGEPILPADFNRGLDEPPGAAEPLSRATIALVYEIPLAPRGKLSIDSADYDEVRAAHPDDVLQLLEANRPALDDLRAAREFDRANWRIKVSTPMINTALPGTSKFRNLAKLARLDGEQLHRAGNDAEAVERARDILHLSRSLMQPPVFLITHMVGLGTDSEAYRLIEFAAPTLRIAKGDEATEGGVVSRQQLRVLIADLLAEDEMRRSAQMGFAAERASLLEMAEQIGRGGGGRWLGAPPTLQNAVLARPLIYHDAGTAMESIERAIAALGAENWPAAQKMIGRVPRDLGGIESVTMWFSQMMTPSLDTVTLSEFRGLTLRRMAATALALRLYEIEHGRKAKSLAALVPDYLPRLPADPLAGDGRAIGYLPDAERPRLYSVGRDGADDGGMIDVLLSGVIKRDSAGLPFFLDGNTPKARVSGSVEALLGLKDEED